MCWVLGKRGVFLCLLTSIFFFLAMGDGSADSTTGWDAEESAGC